MGQSLVLRAFATRNVTPVIGVEGAVQVEHAISTPFTHSPQEDQIDQGGDIVDREEVMSWRVKMGSVSVSA